MVNSEFAPSNIVRFKVNGNTVVRGFVEPWTKKKDQTIRGIARERNKRARRCDKEGKASATQCERENSESKSKIDRACATAIDATTI